VCHWYTANLIAPEASTNAMNANPVTQENGTVGPRAHLASDGRLPPPAAAVQELLGGVQALWVELVNANHVDLRRPGPGFATVSSHALCKLSDHVC
jgi:hypothetical protein